MVEVEGPWSMGPVRASHEVILDDSWDVVAFSTSLVGSLRTRRGVRGLGCCGRGVKEGIGIGRRLRMSVKDGSDVSSGARRRKTVRVRRKYTSKAKGWEWKGRGRGLGRGGWWEEVGVMKAIGVIWKRYRGF